MAYFKQVSGKDVTVTDGKRTIVHKTGAYTTCYGAQYISSTTKAIHKWKFSMGQCGTVTVGIEEAPPAYITEYFCYKTDKINYGYKGTGETWSQDKPKTNAAPSYNKGDVLQMILNLNDGTLSYSLNSKNLGVLYHVKQGKNLSYVMAVALNTYNEGLTLLQYSNNNNSNTNDEKQNDTSNLKKEMQQLKGENERLTQKILRCENENKNIKLNLKDIGKEKEALQKAIKQKNSKLNQYLTDKQILQTKLDEITQVNSRQQNEIKQFKTKIGKHEQIILKLQNCLDNKMEEEQKNDNTQKGLSKILIDLNSEIEAFKQNYNEKKLKEMFKKSAVELIQNDSKTNKTVCEYNNKIGNIILSSKSFVKYINDLQSFIKKISIPNVNEYKTWNLEQIMAWIISLDNGKYLKYTEKLREGFVKSEILSGDLLPELTRHDLSNPPFGINEFIAKRNLEKHFKSLTNPIVSENIIPYIHNENEGTQTEIIDR